MLIDRGGFLCAVTDAWGAWKFTNLQQNNKVINFCYGLVTRQTIISSSCRAQDSARSLYEETKISMISPRPRQQCPLNGLSLMDPRFNHIVVFFKRNRSFHLCATLHDPGMATYRIKGTSKQLIERSNSSGSLGCFESECKHLTILMEPGREMNAERIHISYTYNEIRSKLPPPPPPPSLSTQI